jgi:hypothetical protein
MKILILALALLSTNAFADGAIRTATAKGSVTRFVYDRTPDGMLHSTHEKVCDFEKEVKLYDMRQPNEASFAYVADCESTKNGQAIKVKVEALFRIDQPEGKPAFKEGVGILTARYVSTPEVLEQMIGSGASSEDLEVKNLSAQINYGATGGNGQPAHEETFTAQVSFYDLNQ